MTNYLLIDGTSKTDTNEGKLESFIYKNLKMREMFDKNCLNSKNLVQPTTNTEVSVIYHQFTINTN